MRLFKAIIILYVVSFQPIPYLFGQINEGNHLAQITIPKSNIYWLGEGHATALK
jgi:hypothetical protein